LPIRSHAADFDVSAVGFKQPHHHSQRGCFASSVGPKKSIDFPVRNFKGKVIDCNQRRTSHVKLLCQIRSRNHSKIISRELRGTSTGQYLQLSISRDQSIAMGRSIKTENCWHFSRKSNPTHRGPIWTRPDSLPLCARFRATTNRLWHRCPRVAAGSQSTTS